MDVISKWGFNWLDIAILIVLAWGVYRGLSQGFIGLLLSIGGSVLGFWGAATWSPAVVTVLETRFRAVTTVANWTRQYISIPVEVASTPLKSVNPAEMVKRILALPVTPDLKTPLANYVSSMLANMGGTTASTVGDYLYKGFASLVLQALAFIAILYLIRGIAIILSDMLTHFLVAGQVTSVTNRLLGAAFGIVQYGIMLVAIIGLLTPIAHLATGTGLGETFSGSRLATPLAETFIWAVTRLGGGF